MFINIKTKYNQMVFFIDECTYLHFSITLFRCNFLRLFPVLRCAKQVIHGLLSNFPPHRAVTMLWIIYYAVVLLLLVLFFRFPRYSYVFTVEILVFSKLWLCASVERCIYLLYTFMLATSVEETLVCATIICFLLMFVYGVGWHKRYFPICRAT